MRHLLRHHRRPSLWLGRCGQFVECDCARPACGPFRRSPDTAMIRVVLPVHLRTLAKVNDEVKLEVPFPVTQRAILDALEVAYPTLRGTVRDQGTQKRRALVRFFACGEDFSHESPDS